MILKKFKPAFMAEIGLIAVIAVGLAACVPQDDLSPAQQEQDAVAAIPCPKDGDPKITNLLEPIRQKHKVPAICAAIVNSEGLVAVGAIGVRRSDTDIPVTVNDLWHLGSDTKAMTASMMGRLVEQGALRWDSALAEIFPELTPVMQPELKDVTVIQLLAHRSGLEENYNWHKLSQHGTLPQQRYAAVQKAVSEKPKYTPGSGYHYSNLGYVVAGAVIEKVTSSTWEEQIKTLLFEPLQMTTAGFGGVGTPGQLDQPWGHHSNGTPVSENGPKIDNPQLIAPAGCVHSAISDWAKFVIDQLRGAMGKPALLEPSTYKMIQTPPFADEYALGWGVVQRDWGKGTVLTHSGSNTMNFSNLWIAPNCDFAVLVCINQGGDTTFTASDEAIAALIAICTKK